jgi:ketosteroid isomerase-like protein
MPGMDKPMDDHGKYLTIWEKQKDGSLKVKVETWNSDVQPMNMQATAQ